MAKWHADGHVLYRDDALIGMMDSPEIAAEIVRAMNSVETLRERIAEKAAEQKPVPRGHCDNPVDDPLTDEGQRADALADALASPGGDVLRTVPRGHCAGCGAPYEGT